MSGSGLFDCSLLVLEVGRMCCVVRVWNDFVALDLDLEIVGKVANILKKCR